MPRKFRTDVDLTGNQIIDARVETRPANDSSLNPASTEFVTTALSGLGGGDMLKSEYASATPGVVTEAEVAGAVAYADVTGKPATFPPDTHGHIASQITDFATAVDSRVDALVDGAAGSNNDLDTLQKLISAVALFGRHNQLIGDGSAASYTVTHGLNSFFTVVEVSLVSTGETVITDVTRPTANTVVITFDAPIATDSHRVAVRT